MSPLDSAFPTPFATLLLVGVALVGLGTWWAHALERRRTGADPGRAGAGWHLDEPAHRWGYVGEAESGRLVYEETAAS